MLTDLDYELLSAYIDGALTEPERSAFESRLQNEPELSRELDELRATVMLLNNLPPRRAPRDFTLDTRYAHRSSFFFTSATFSALSTAAAIILFALGAYLFTGNKAPSQNTSSAPAAQVSQSQQSQSTQFALLPTSTGATLDKSAAATSTSEADLLNTFMATLTIENSPVINGDLAATGAFAQESAAVQPTALADHPPLFQPDVIQPTTLPNDGIAASSPAIPASPDEQGRTSEATETLSLQQYAVPNTSSSAPANDGAAAVPMTFETPSGGGAAVPPSPVEETEANISAGSAFAVTQLPFTATFSPSVALLPTATVTATPSPQPTTTVVPTATHTPQPTATLSPTFPAQRDTFATPNTSDSTPLLLIGLGIILLIVAIATTIVRRRNRL